MAKILTKIAHAWNAFKGYEKDRLKVDATSPGYDVGYVYSSRPDRPQFRIANERTIISSIITRMSMDAAAVEVRHCRVDSSGTYIEDIQSGLNNCLTVEANLDQAATHFRQNAFGMLFDKGVCAIVPVDTSLDPNNTGSFDIQTMRVGEIVGWAPQTIRVKVYNEATGRQEEIEVAKKYAAIVENPLYSVMNEYSAMLQRVMRRLSLLDVVDEQASSGKLDIIIQLPYVIKSEARRLQAEQRRTDIEFQLKGSQYGIAYTDGTEKITQLNRPADNNLLKTVEYLTSMLYAELGITQSIMDGTADEKTMLNYRNRVIEPLLTALVEAMRRTFLTKTGRSQGQTILYFSNNFKLVPLSEMAEIGDKFTRNEILSANEMRSLIGIKPSKDPKADELRNSNMPLPDPPAPKTPTKVESVPPEPKTETEEELGGDSQNGSN